MQIKWPWFERDFIFDFPVEKMPEIIERLLGTPVRIAAIVGDLDESVHANRERTGSWSIKENIGHLLYLEPLWLSRIDDILNGLETMREADLSNQSTSDANFNAQDIHKIVSTFQRDRMETVRALRELTLDQWSATALHPRLGRPMRIVDLCQFVADHDDYHLARVRYLAELFTSKPSP